MDQVFSMDKLDSQLSVRSFSLILIFTSLLMVLVINIFGRGISTANLHSAAQILPFLIIYEYASFAR